MYLGSSFCVGGKTVEHREKRKQIEESDSENKAAILISKLRKIANDGSEICENDHDLQIKISDVKNIDSTNSDTNKTNSGGAAQKIIKPDPDENDVEITYVKKEGIQEKTKVHKLFPWEQFLNVKVW